MQAISSYAQQRPQLLTAVAGLSDQLRAGQRAATPLLFQLPSPPPHARGASAFHPQQRHGYAPPNHGRQARVTSRCDVAIFGATGESGQALARAGQAMGLSVALLGRDPTKLAKLAAELGIDRWQAVQIDAPRALRAVLRECRVVVNCAGPFERTGPALIAAALESACDYVDVAAEATALEFAQREASKLAKTASHSVYLGAAAIGAALGQWLAELAVRQHAPNNLAMPGAVELGYALAEAPTSAASRHSCASLISVEPGSAATTSRFAFPKPFAPALGLSVATLDSVALRARPQIHQSNSYVSVRPHTRLGLAANELGGIARPGLTQLQRVLGKPWTAQLTATGLNLLKRPAEDSRSFAIVAKFIPGSGSSDHPTSTLALTGKDTHECTTFVASEVVSHLLSANNRRVTSGSAGELLDAEKALHRLQKAGHIRVLSASTGP